MRRRMTRKRFCKKAMGLGASRNGAAALASMVRPGLPYAKLYRWAEFEICTGHFNAQARKTAKALRKFFKAADRRERAKGAR